MKEAKPKFKLPPSEYKEILSRVQLVEISLRSCTSEISKSSFSNKLKITIDDSVKYDIIDTSTAIVTQEYSLKASEAKSKTAAVSISCAFDLVLNSTTDITTDFMDIYINFNVHINTWPYFRELVQNMTQRMNIPPLTLPLFK